jgi:hypothetical protein
MRPTILLGGLGLLANAGCFLFGGGPEPEGDPGPSRCDMDRHDCEEATIAIDPSCTLEGELVAEVGIGVERFEPLADGQAPNVYEGSGGFQTPGVTHTVIGVRIEGAALDRYASVGARVGLFEAQACVPAPDGEIAACGGNPLYGSRTVVLGQSEPLALGADGAIEEFGITFISDFEANAGDFVVQILVEDPCGRTALAQHPFSGPPFQRP